MNMPIYEGADTSKGTLLLLVIGFVLRPGVSGYGMSDIPVI